MTNTNSPHWPIFGLAVLLLLISLPFPVFETINPEGDFEARCHGWEALLVGWFGVLAGCLAWLANPLSLLVAVLLHFKKWSNAFIAASVAACCALTTLFIYKPIPTGEPFENVLCIGAWFWFASIACVWFSSFVARRNAPSVHQAEPISE